jgi:hypothetical protein
MKKVFLLMILALCCSLPARAQLQPTEVPRLVVPVAKTTDIRGSLEYKEAKRTFRERHPKIYKSIRKVRFICHFCQPVVEFSGAVAQIVMVFVL